MFIWIRGHSNIPRNEKGDQEAKNALDFIDTPFLNISTYSNTKNQIKTQIKIKWQNHCHKQNSKLREIKNNIF